MPFIAIVLIDYKVLPCIYRITFTLHVLISVRNNVIILYSIFFARIRTVQFQLFTCIPCRHCLCASNFQLVTFCVCVHYLDRSRFYKFINLCRCLFIIVFGNFCTRIFKRNDNSCLCKLSYSNYPVILHNWLIVLGCFCFKSYIEF